MSSSGEPTGEEKEIITFENINQLLLKNTKDQEVHDSIRQFVSKCRSSSAAKASEKWKQNWYI